MHILGELLRENHYNGRIGATSKEPTGISLCSIIISKNLLDKHDMMLGMSTRTSN